MDGKAARSIETILEAYERKQRAARLEAELRRAQRAEFLEQFALRGRDVIRPVMQEAAELLRRSGHEYEIIEHTGDPGSDKSAEAAVTLMIFPDGEHPSDPRHEDYRGWPHIAFIVSSGRNTVLAYECAMMPGVGGHAGTAAEYPVDQITPECVREHIVSVLSRAMGIGRVRRTAEIRRRIRRPGQDDPIPAAFKYLAR